jgi:hypothetical protein
MRLRNTGVSNTILVAEAFVYALYVKKFDLYGIAFNRFGEDCKTGKYLLCETKMFKYQRNETKLDDILRNETKLDEM